MWNKLKSMTGRHQLVRKARRVASSPLYSFILIASAFGLLTIALAPPLTGGDEEAHFVRAYGISEGNFIIHQGETISMPKSYRQTLGCLQTKQPIAGEMYKYAYSKYGEQKKAELRCALNIKQSLSDVESVQAGAAGYSPLTYIPQVSAILLGRVFNMPVVAMVYLVRIFTLAAYIGLIVAAIRLLPNRKWALAGVALLPVPIMQVINPGADYMLIGSTAIFVAAILRSRTLNAKEIKKHGKILAVITSVAALFMVTPKGIFPGICFLPLIFFFTGFRRYIGAKILVFAVIFVIAIMWQLFGAPVAAGQAHAASSSSILSFPHAFLKTMFFKANFHSWVDSDFVFGTLGLGVDSPVGMPAIIVTFINMLMGLYVFAEYSSERVRNVRSKMENKFLTIVGFGVCMAVILGSFAALYLLARDLQRGDDIINGVSTRYFYAGFLLLAVLPFRRYIRTTRRFYIAITLIGSMLVLGVQCIAIAVRYGWGIL